jgi:hypothetical protein
MILTTTRCSPVPVSLIRCNEMRALILLSVMAASAWAQPTSLRLGSTQTASAAIPASPITVSNERIEFGITKRSGTFDASDAGKSVFSSYGLVCRTYAGGSLVYVGCWESHNTSTVATVDITGMSDVRYRFQRSVNGIIGTSTWSKGLWDGQGNLISEAKLCPDGINACTGETSYSWQSTKVVGDTSIAFDIRFVRWYSTLVPLGTRAPEEVPDTPADLADYAFENALTDASPNHLTLTMSSGSPSYVASPTYPPLAGFGGDQIGVAANQTITLHGDMYSFSSTVLNGSPTSYAWTLTSKQYPTMDGTLATPSAASTAMVLNDYLGTYAVSLQVSDASGSSPTVTSKIGAVPENPDHTLKYYPNPATGVDSADIQFQTGKLVRYGTSAYPGVDAIMKAYAEQLEFHVPLAGTLAYSGTAHVTNSGGMFHVVCDTPGTCGFASHWRIYYHSTGALVSIVVSSNVATATISAPHGFIVGRRLTVAGSATSALNGSYVVGSVPASTTLTFATSGVGDGTYTDTGLRLTGGINDPNSGLPLANYFCLGSCPGYVPLATNNNLTSIVVSGTTATVTTAVAHGLEMGQIVIVGNTNIAGLDSNWWIISAVPTATTFQFSVAPIRGGITEAPVVKAGTYTVSQSYIEVEESDFIHLWWAAPGDGNGRYTDAVTSVNSDDDLTIGTGNLANTSINDGSTGHSFSKPSRLEITAGWTNSNASWTYYEAPLALFRQFLQTGIDTYLTKFRNVTDAHWRIALDHGFSGYAYGESRVFALRSVIVRALDAYPQWWPGIAYKLDNNNANPCKTTTSPMAQGTGFQELRDFSYYLSYNAAVARSAQNSDRTPDTTTRATYCTYTKQCVNNVFNSTQNANGSWTMDPSGGNRSYPFQGPGVYPWMMGLATNGLSHAHILFTDGISCPAISDKATVAATTLSTLKAAVDFQLAQGFDSNLGSFYDVDFTFAPDSGSANELGGAINVTNGSTAVTGSGSAFLSSFLPDGSTLLQVDDGHTAIGHAVVGSVASDLAMTLSAPWAGPTATPALGYSKSSGCATVTGSGTLHLTQGSATVTEDGSGVDLRTIFLPDGTTYLQPYSLTNRAMFKIVGVTANTLTLEVAWQPSSLSTTTWKKVNGGCTDVCGPRSTAQSCAGFANGGGLQYGAGFIGDTGNNTEQLAGIGYYYAVSGDTTYQTQLGDLLNATFPLGLQPYLPQLAKIYGQIGGAGGNPNALAYILAPSGACKGIAFSPESHGAPAGGDLGSVLVTVPDQTCSWTALSRAVWLTITSGGSGTGNGTINYKVAVNAGSSRAGTIVNDRGTGAFMVTQDNGCTFSIVPTSGSVGAAGGTLPIAITASDSSCVWTASSTDPWLTFNKSSGAGTDSVNIFIAANQGLPRSGSATIAGYSVTVTEAGAVVNVGGGTSIAGDASLAGNLKIE